MNLHNFIIVGSGPAATSSALQLAGEGVLMLDVGIDAPSIPPDFSGNLYELRKGHRNLFPHLIGNEFQSMRNIFCSNKMSIKLKAPYLDYIIKDSSKLAPIKSKGFGGVVSLSKGGLANAWGAGVIRYTDEDLNAFPLTYEDLDPFYDILTEHIGISGENDDLEHWFFRDENLHPPLMLNPFMQSLFDRYNRKRNHLNRQGFFMGRPRVAILSRDKNGRKAYQYDHMDFFRSHIPAIYTPAYTLDALIERCHINYKSGFFVKSYKEHSDYVSVVTHDISNGKEEIFHCRHLLLAAGALGTARIVLHSNNDHETHLPFLDNPMACLPLFRPQLIGKIIRDQDASAGQLNCIYSQNKELGNVLIAMISGNGSLRSDLLFETPLPVTVSRTLLKQTAFAMGIGIIFFPCPNSPDNNVKLNNDGTLQVTCKNLAFPSLEKTIARFFMSLGFLCHASLAQHPQMGSGLHFAGMLPMQKSPARYQCHPDGRLFGTHSVYVVDGANFSALPAKNLTFTIMANSMRIAKNISGKRL